MHREGRGALAGGQEASHRFEPTGSTKKSSKLLACLEEQETEKST